MPVNRLAVADALADYLEALESGQPGWAAEIRDRAASDPVLAEAIRELEEATREHPDA